MMDNTLLMQAEFPIFDTPVRLPIDVPDVQRVHLATCDVPDCIWPTDNPMDIPVLDLNYQADALDLPVMTWGAQSKKKRMCGTYHFYTDERRFSAIWKHPQDLINTGCVTVVEPNYSCYQQTPVAVTMYHTYRKRWLARYWQSKGLRIFVDLNVNLVHREINLIGVPEGWQAFATRGYTERLEDTCAEYELACEIAGTGSILFMVYGGGKRVKRLCWEQKWLHVPEWGEIVKILHKRETLRRLLNG